MGNTVCVLDYAQGKFNCHQIISTLPEDFCGEPYPAVLADNPISLAEQAWTVMFSAAAELQTELSVEISGNSSIMRRDNSGI